MFFSRGEVPGDLIEGSQYTEKQLVEFLTDNENIAIIVEDNKQLNGISGKKHKVLKKLEGYIHNGRGGSYHIPRSKKQIILID